MKNICIICGKEFILNIHNQKCCSIECRKIHRNNRTRNINYNKEIELGLPKEYIRLYGYDFLKNNPVVLESVKLIQQLIGHKNIPIEIKESRLNNRKKYCKKYNKIYYKEKIKNK